MEKPQTYAAMKGPTGLSIIYSPREDGSVAVQATSENGKPVIESIFSNLRIDEAHILFMEACELLRSRAKVNEPPASIRGVVEKLFAVFRGEKVSFADGSGISGGSAAMRKPSAEFIPNPGKQLTMIVDGVTYERLPVRTRIITMKDTDLVPLINDYVKPYLKPGDVVYVSEKALTITQGRIVDMGDIKPGALARLFARNVSNYYGSSDFHGFGHGTTIAMQLFIEEAGYPRALFAAAVSAITRPFGVKGAFYYLCGKRAKSIDCPMSFLILEYAHSAKLAPNDPNGAARRIKKALGGYETVILDANYRGAFSLGKSTNAISEEFIGKLFADNPLGQSDEMTPFCIVRKK
jgi:hypothetical protein